MKKFTLGILGATTLGLAASFSAFAASPSQLEEFTASVSYSDLRIDDAEGAKVLYARIQQASAKACKLASVRELGSLERYRDAKACYSDMLDDFVARFDSEELKKLHRG